MSEISTKLQSLHTRMAAACARAGRAPESVRLVAVSKSIDAGHLLEAVAAGQRCFGESYLQEALPKIAATEEHAGQRLEWHFIGPLQANKTTAVAETFGWVHGVDRERIALRLSAARGASQAPLEVCVQINISGETSKSGCAPEHAQALCAAIVQLPQLRLRGLMAIPAPAADIGATRDAFRRLRLLAETIRSAGIVDAAQFDTLSMGMSDDFEVAIEEGATLVRIGSALFGPRPK